MITQHQNVFFEAANQFKCWIGLREPNEFAERWFSHSNCAGKDKGCKAKTADNPNFRYAGLVTSPEMRPEAFEARSYPAAMSSWRNFATIENLPAGYSVITEGPERGLVQDHNRRFIFSDYDLMGFLPTDDDGKRPGIPKWIKDRLGIQEFRTELDTKRLNDTYYDHVAPFLNRRFVTNLIFHGPEFSYLDVGAKESESVWWFQPDFELSISPSSMLGASMDIKNKDERLASRKLYAN